MLMLGDFTETHENNTKILRHVAALCVITTHCIALSGHFIEEPLYRLFPETNLGILGVQIFFVLSGFLVAQSWLNDPSALRFASARALRVYPALVVATIFTISLAAFSTTLTFREYIVSRDTWHYFVLTATGIRVTDLLPQVYEHNPYPKAANGSLWTLPIELRLYAILLSMGAIGLLTHRRLLTIVLLTTGSVIAFSTYVEFIGLSAANVWGFVWLFGLGTLAFVWRQKLPLSLLAAAALVVLYCANPFGVARGVMSLPALAYLVLLCGYHPRLHLTIPPQLSGDISYGLYVYAFPIQQALVAYFQPIGPWPLLALTLPPLILVALLSWKFVESPALALKQKLRRQ